MSRHLFRIFVVAVLLVPAGWLLGIIGHGEIMREMGKRHFGIVRVNTKWSYTYRLFPPTMSSGEKRFTDYHLNECAAAPQGTQMVCTFNGRLSGPVDERGNLLRKGPDRSGIVVLNLDGREFLKFDWSDRVRKNTAAVSASLDRIAMQGSPGLILYSRGNTKGVVLDAIDDSKSMSLAWDPASSRIVYERGGKIRVFDLGTMQSSAIASGFSPTWSPVGKWIAFRSPDDRAIMMSAITREMKVILPDKKIAGPLCFSPDSQYVLVSEYDVKGILNFLMSIPALYDIVGRLSVYRMSDGKVEVIRQAIRPEHAASFFWMIVGEGAGYL